LEKIKILITRSKSEAKDFGNYFSIIDADLIYLPTIITDVIENKQVKNMFENFNSYDFLLFTSANAAKHFFSLRNKYSPDLNLKNISVVCVGSKTATYCKNNGIKELIVPNNYSAYGLVEYFKSRNIKGKRFLIPSSVLARDELSSGLKEQGGKVFKIPIYRVGLPEMNKIKKSLEVVKQFKPDVFAFTSPSSFNNFLKLLKINNPVEYFEGTVVAAIGKTTEKEIRNKRVKVSVVPNNFTLEHLAKAIVDYLKKKTR